MVGELGKVLKRLHYPLEVMLLCARWYTAYPLSFRHLKEMVQERGVFVDRSGSTILNSAISGNSDVFGLTNIVGQEGVFHGQAKKESQRRTACTQAAHKRIQSPSRLGGAA